jgi:hypothetical protein
MPSSSDPIDPETRAVDVFRDSDSYLDGLRYGPGSALVWTPRADGPTLRISIDELMPQE